MKHIFVFAALCAHPMFALTCGQVVSGVVTLTEDLHCNSQTALRVGADNTTINLNGFTINCTGAGYLGSCQDIAGTRGIEVVSKKGVQILGPGAINGFSVGAMLLSANLALVKGVTISGPSNPLTIDSRTWATGLYVAGVPCPIVLPGQSGPLTADIRLNDISNQAQGIHLENQDCARISGNQIHNITAKSAVFGVLLYGASNNEISRNAIFAVGTDQSLDAGLTLMQGSSRNGIVSNSISNNHGYGITVFNKSSQNKAVLNTVRFNTTDLTDLSDGSGNTWNVNNICKTEAGSVPAGVCNPLE
jgi:parallel beta-helix repeat protein